jgi:hypothetical protein
MHSMNLVLRLSGSPDELNQSHELHVQIIAPDNKSEIQPTLVVDLTPPPMIVELKQSATSVSARNANWLTVNLSYLGITFPSAGKYVFHFSVDNKAIGETALELVAEWIIANGGLTMTLSIDTRGRGMSPSPKELEPQLPRHVDRASEVLPSMPIGIDGNLTDHGLLPAGSLDTSRRVRVNSWQFHNAVPYAFLGGLIGLISLGQVFSDPWMALLAGFVPTSLLLILFWPEKWGERTISRDISKHFGRAAAMSMYIAACASCAGIFGIVGHFVNVDWRSLSTCGFFVPLFPMYWYYSRPGVMRARLQLLKNWNDAGLLTRPEYQLLKKKAIRWWGDRMFGPDAEETRINEHGE